MKTGVLRAKFRSTIARWIEELRCKKTYDRDVEIPGPTTQLEQIPTEEFGKIINEMRDDGWRKVIEYSAFDAWIDHGMMVLRREGVSVKFQWTYWGDGRIEGPPAIVETLKRRLDHV